MRTARMRQLVAAAVAPAALVFVWAAGPAIADEPGPPAEVPPVTVPADAGPPADPGPPADAGPPADVPVDDVPVDEDAAVGEVDGVPVAVAEALVPPAEQGAHVAVPAERVATGEVDGVEVGLVQAPVPPTPPAERPPVAPPVVRLSVMAPTPPAPVLVPGPAVADVPTVALVLAAWG